MNYSGMTVAELRLYHVLRDLNGEQASRSELMSNAGINSVCKFYTAMAGLKRRGLLPGTVAVEPTKKPKPPIVSTVPQTPKERSSEAMRLWNTAFPNERISFAQLSTLLAASGNNMELFANVLRYCGTRQLQRPFGYVKAALTGEAKKIQERRERIEPENAFAIAEEEIEQPTAELVAVMREEARRARANFTPPSFDL